MPSTRNSHCHPANPKNPFKERMRAASGAPVCLFCFEEERGWGIRRYSKLVIVSMFYSFIPPSMSPNKTHSTMIKKTFHKKPRNSGGRSLTNDLCNGCTRCHRCVCHSQFPGCIEFRQMRPHARESSAFCQTKCNS